MVDLAAFPGKVWPAVAPPVPLLVGQAAAAVLARRATQFTLATKQKKKQRLQRRLRDLCHFAQLPTTKRRRRLLTFDPGSLPEMTESAQVPLTSTLPSGQVHLAPVGLSRHMKSQDILRHGLGAAERARAAVGWPRL